MSKSLPFFGKIILLAPKKYTICQETCHWCNIGVKSKNKKYCSPECCTLAANKKPVNMTRT